MILEATAAFLGGSSSTAAFGGPAASGWLFGPWGRDEAQEVAGVAVRGRAAIGLTTAPTDAIV